MHARSPALGGTVAASPRRDDTNVGNTRCIIRPFAFRHVVEIINVITSTLLVVHEAERTKVQS